MFVVESWPPGSTPAGVGDSGDGTREARRGYCLTVPPCLPGIVEIRSVHVGTVVIKAVYSGFYVAMDRRGRLYGSVSDGQYPAGGDGWWGSQPASHARTVAGLLCGL